MAGSLTPTLLTLASGFQQGGGLAINPGLVAALSAFESAPLSQQIRTIINDNEDNQIITSTLVALPSFVTGLSSDGTDTVEQIRNRANTILPGGAPGIQKFSSLLGQSISFIGTSFQWKGAATELEQAQFDSFGLGVSNFSEMITGGASGLFAKNASGLSPDQAMKKAASAFSCMGSAFDTSDLTKLGDPAAFISNLQKQGFGNVAGLEQKLTAAGIDPEDAEAANPVVLKNILSLIKGPELTRILNSLGVKLPSGASVSSLADLLDANKFLSPEIAAAIPGGDLAGLGNTLVNIGGKFADPGAVANFVDGIEVPNLPHLNQIKSPVPSAVASQIKNSLGNGSGPFGTPTLNEMLGTVTGYKHTEAFQYAVLAQQHIMSTNYGTAISAALSDLAAAISGSSTLTVSDALLAVTSAFSQLNQSADTEIQNILATANTYMLSSQTQIATETANLTAAGIGIARTPTTFDVGPVTSEVASSNVFNFAAQFHSYGVDRQKVGYNEFFNKIATDDTWGDAVRAALIEGRMLAKQSAAGIQATTKADPEKFLASQSNNNQ